ncbi:amidase [Pikeienuella piscinae]|uniref:Amidase n=1 Tax=Pikeienuella piscinae TaxID=2748098 RepID=A0A7L5C267_9RHOB|nr:amidase [Pikeienuella piscinae]QIE56264.1 amidase [Pikeienuella piscinae]
MAEITELSAAETGRRIESGALDAREATEAYLSAIDAHADASRIYTRVRTDEARREAAAAAGRAKSGLRRGPLDGVPISWKDLFDFSGEITESGSAMLKGRTPEVDAVVVANAKRAGLVALGKTHQTELAFSGLGVNPVTATPPNRFDAALAPGGSSSGAAASVVFGLAAAGIGSDTGGSVRIPAAWNSLVGLKTTHGLLSDRGLVPLCARFDTTGPLCRTVEDSALLLEAMGGGSAPDLSGATLKGARFAVLETVALDADCRDAPRAAFETAVDALSRAGAKVERVEAPEVAAALPLSPVVFTGEAWAEWGETIEEKGDLMFAPVRDRFRSGATITAASYIRDWRRLERIRSEWAKRMAAFDAVLIPSAPLLPPNVEGLLADAEFFAQENLLTLRNTRIANLLGLCALTLPTATPACGIMLMGRPYGEAHLCRFGAAAAPVVAG